MTDVSQLPATSDPLYLKIWKTGGEGGTEDTEGTGTERTPVETEGDKEQDERRAAGGEGISSIRGKVFTIVAEPCSSFHSLY